MKIHNRLQSGIIQAFPSIFLSILVISNASNIPSQLHGQTINNPILTINEGVASGDVTYKSAMIWSRANNQSIMHVKYDNNSEFLHPNSAIKWVDNKTDLVGKIKVDDLRPNTKYFYKVWFSSSDNRTKSSAILGSFRTAPNPNSSGNSISFILGADIGGQGFCREVKNGYLIFEKMKSLLPDFYIQNGDMIYAINDCPKDRPDGDQNIPGNFSGIADAKVDWKNEALVHDTYLKHWTYNRADPHLQAFLGNTSMYMQWDDHEVINDFGSKWSYWNSLNKNRTGYQNLVQSGRETFFNFSPIERNQQDPDRIYRSFHWGKDMDLLILDARTYRSRNDLQDIKQYNKTLLGGDQLSWLKETLANSNATWKIISSDVPMSIPTGSNASLFGRDGWANGIDKDFSSKTGFERELWDLMKFIDDHDINNVVFVTTDAHFPAILKYNADVNGDGDPVNVYEIVCGPLSAIRFGIPGIPLPKFDPTFQPTSLYVEGGILNFAYFKIHKGSDGLMHLSISILGEDGRPRHGSLIDLGPNQNTNQND
ncbi:MAG TPA: alkaline phosphatase D family protein [Nitrososphaeraceae archaeon]